MTGEYTFVTAERQNELTRRIQQKLAAAAQKPDEKVVGPPEPTAGTSDVFSILAETKAVTTIIQ
jgi:hypothetical protein